MSERRERVRALLGRTRPLLPKAKTHLDDDSNRRHAITSKWVVRRSRPWPSDVHSLRVRRTFVQSAQSRIAVEGSSVTHLEQTSKRLEPIPTTPRERRFHNCGRRLRAPLIRVIRLVTGQGPRGRSSEVCEFRNTFAPELWGVIGENVVFRGQRWLVVTAPGEMFLGIRKDELIDICARLRRPDRPVLLLEEEDVRRLDLLGGPRRFCPKFDELPEHYQKILSPLFQHKPDQSPGYSGNRRIPPTGSGPS